MSSSEFSSEEYSSVPTFYEPLLHAITVSNTLVTIISVWVIVWHSPPSMAVYKWFLLNVAVSLIIELDRESIEELSLLKFN